METTDVALMNSYADHAIQTIHTLMDENILLKAQLALANAKIKLLIDNPIPVISDGV